MRIVWYPLALDDLESLHSYIARDGPGSDARRTSDLALLGETSQL